MTKNIRIPVMDNTILNKKNKIIGRVRIVTNLDLWNGEYFSSGVKCEHLGLATLADLSICVKIHSFDDVRKPYAVIISKEEARNLIYNYNHLELLKTKKFLFLNNPYDFDIVEIRKEDIETIRCNNTYGLFWYKYINENNNKRFAIIKNVDGIMKTKEDFKEKYSCIKYLTNTKK